jgi:Tfp pilus assembly protein FimT
LSFVVLLAMVMMAISVPIMQSALYGYRLRSAVARATWAMQATRCQAIMKGYPFALAFDSTTLTYQVSSQPPGATGFSNVGSAVPLSGSNVTFSQSTTLRFKPNGIVQATTGQLTFSISYQGNTKTITVSSYGDVSASP